MFALNPDIVPHARFPTPDFHRICHTPKGSGKRQKVSFRFSMDNGKEHRFNNHHSIMKMCRFANRSRFMENLENALFREIPPRAPIAGGGGGGARPGPAPAPHPARTRFFSVAQWLKRQQCVAMLLRHQQQPYTMYLQIATNRRARYNQWVSKYRMNS